MTWATTTAYKTLLARAIMGESVDLTPATVHVGNGTVFTSGSPNPPAASDTALANELTSAAIADLTRSGFVVTSTGIIPGGGSPLTINELCFKTAGGVMIARATFENTTFQSPFNYNSILNMPPEL